MRTAGMTGDAVPVAGASDWRLECRRWLYGFPVRRLAYRRIGGHRRGDTTVSRVNPGYGSIAAGKQIGVLGESARFGNLQLAPDGKRLAVSVGDLAERGSNIWLFDVARGLRTRFTFDPSSELSSVWSPDGSRIVFNASRKGPPIFDLYQKASSGAGDEEELLADSPSLKEPVDWSQDGRFVLFMVTQYQKTLSDLWVLPLFGDRKPFSIRKRNS